MFLSLSFSLPSPLSKNKYIKTSKKEKSLLSLWYREDTFHLGILSPVFRKKKEDHCALLESSVSQVPSAQNKFHVKEKYFGIRHSGFLQKSYLVELGLF